MKTMSNLLSPERSTPAKSAVTTRKLPCMPLRFSLMSTMDEGLLSTKTTSSAPRERHSMPSAPLPAKRSSTLGLLDPVRGGADAVVRGGQEFFASVSACDDSHSSPPNSFDTATFCAVKISFSVTRMSRGMSCGSVTMPLAPRQENATPTLTQSGKRERNLS